MAAPLDKLSDMLRRFPKEKELVANRGRWGAVSGQKPILELVEK